MPEKVAWQGIAVNGTHSWKSYAHGIVSPEVCKELGLECGTLVRDLKPEEFPPELLIVGTNFSGEIAAAERKKYPEGRPVFPDGCRGLLFVNCNLDNVELPPDSKLCENSCHQQHQAFTTPELGEKGATVMVDRDWAVTVTVDAKDPEKVTVEPVAVMGTPAAVADWQAKREPPLDPKDLPPADAAEVKP